MRTLIFLANVAVIALAIVVAAALAYCGGWLVAQEFVREYKDSPYALIGASLISIAAAIGAGLSLGAAAHPAYRRSLTVLATLAPLLVALITVVILLLELV